ncbi:MAG TPA: VCBS repeat-containing protein [Solirubrobacteraceae bacterium]
MSAFGGPVQATLSWQAADFGVKDPRLVVVRAGVTLYDGSPVGDDRCSIGCIFAVGGAVTPLKVVDLDADGEPEVVVDAFTGGAHCCSLTEIFRFTGSAYARLEADWGSTGYTLKDLDGDGRPELSGYDWAFEDAFTSHAASFEPPLVLVYDPAAKTGFRDVTRRFPALVRKNARDALHTLRRARRQHYETLGIVAAYVADLYLLGRGREVRPYLKRARKRGDLRTIAGRAPRSYESRLLKFLHKQGYR